MRRSDSATDLPRAVSFNRLLGRGVTVSTFPQLFDLDKSTTKDLRSPTTPRDDAFVAFIGSDIADSSDVMGITQNVLSITEPLADA